jgi:threonine dehydrogenase-like Zn-dependent dehydrogenase
MRALEVTEERKLAEAELPAPEPQAGEVAIDVAFCGICGSDLHMLPSPAIAPGTVMGHEFSGTVAALGEGVEGWELGERVCVIPVDPCGECPNCLAGNEHLCVQAPLRGHGLGGRSGGFAERVTAPATSLFRLPEQVSDEHGALVEPLAVGVHAARLAELDPSEPVCVLGAGPIGVMTCLALRAEGFERLVVIEPGERRRERIEALELVRARGVVVAAGVLEEPVPLNQLLLILKEARIQGCFAYRREDFERAIELLASGELPGDELVTEVVPMGRAQEMFDELRSPGTDQLKVLLRP